MFINRLNETRKKRGLTAQQMADFLEVTIGTYRHYENGHSSPTIYTLAKIGDILDVSLDYLMCRDAFIQKHSVQ